MNVAGVALPLVQKSGELAAIVAAGMYANQRGVRKYRFNPKRPGPDMKKQTGFQEFSEKLSAVFSILLFVGRGRPENREINFSGGLKGLEKRVSRKFESYMMKKNGGLASTEKPCTFLPLDMQKTPETPGFFVQASFLFCQYGRVEQKRFQLSTLLLEAYHPGGGNNITPSRRPYHP